MDNKPAARILITGFGPFPGQPDNPSARLVRGLAQKLRHHFAACGNNAPVFRCAILRTEYHAARARLQKERRDFRPDITICFGVAARTPEIRLETTARNQMLADRPDAAGYRPGRAVIDPHGPGSISATLPLAAIGQALDERDIQTRLSGEAGGYLCNYVFYHLMRDIAENDRAEIGGFVHVPEGDRRMLLTAALAIVETATRDGDRAARPVTGKMPPPGRNGKLSID